MNIKMLFNVMHEFHATCTLKIQCSLAHQEMTVIYRLTSFPDCDLAKIATNPDLRQFP